MPTLAQAGVGCQHQACWAAADGLLERRVKVASLAALERHDLEPLRRGKLLNGRDEAIVAGFQEGRRFITGC